MLEKIKLALFYVLLAANTIACLTWALITFIRGEVPTGVTSLLLGLGSLGMIGAITEPGSVRLPASCRFDASGTVVRPPWVFNAATVLMVVTSLSGVALFFAWCLPTGRFDMPEPPVDSHSPLFAVVFFIPVLAVLIPFLTSLLSVGAVVSHRGGSMNYLRLTPQGFENVVIRTTARGAWSDIADIDPPTTEPDRSRGHALTLAMTDGSVARIPTHSLVADDGPLRAMIRFYWRNPALRDELTDGRAAQRLRAVDFAE